MPAPTAKRRIRDLLWGAGTNGEQLSIDLLPVRQTLPQAHNTDGRGQTGASATDYEADRHPHAAQEDGR